LAGVSTVPRGFRPLPPLALRKALFQSVDAQLQPLVIGHREGCDAADHAEDRREQRTFVGEQQGYAHQEGGNAAKGREGKPVPAMPGTIADAS